MTPPPHRCYDGAVIVDSHSHVFPDQATAPGFDEPVEFFRPLQRAMGRHGQPTRRLDSGALVAAPPPIWRADDPSPAGWLDVDFRVGRHGRYVWTVDGVDYYKQYQPPWLDPMVADPNLVVALMDNAGVDRCVLQNDTFYGKLNDYFGRAVRRFPDRFLGTIHVEEDRIDEPAARDELRRGAHELGLRGIFFGNRSSWWRGYRLMLDEPAAAPFWAEAERLGLVVYWAVGQGPTEDEAGYLDQVARVRRVLDRHPGLPSVFCGGVPNRYLDDPAAPLPDDFAALVARDNLCFELCFPISYGRTEDYPFPRAQESVRRLYRRLGGRHLVWGSDLPNVERHCTYRQSRTYIERHCAFVEAADMPLILGDNLARLFRPSS